MAQRFELDDAERDLIAELYPALRRIAAVAGPVDGEPDDLVQEALLRTLSKQPLTELDSPLAYLRRAIVNLASNERRGAARRRKALERLGVDEGELPVYPADLEAILDLPPRQRAILYLVEVEGLQYAEAAGQLGISSVSARQLAARARKRARLGLGVASG